MFNKNQFFLKEIVKDFIENRSDLMDEDTKNLGCANLMKFLRQNNSNFNDINEILLHHQWISTSELLQDLRLKMQNQEQLLEELFDKCSAGFLGEAIYTPYELERIANAFPSKITEIAEFIRNDVNTLHRLEKSVETDADVFSRIAHVYPELDLRNFSNQKNVL